MNAFVIMTKIRTPGWNIDQIMLKYTEIIGNNCEPFKGTLKSKQKRQIRKKFRSMKGDKRSYRIRTR